MNTATVENKTMYTINAQNFFKIPGSPIAYWVSKNVLNAYRNENLDVVAQPRHGLATSDNARFLRLWHEVNLCKVSLNSNADVTKKWFPMNKGGEFRKWYGNNDWIINYENDGKELKDFAITIYKCSSRTIQNTQFYFKKGLTWSALTSGGFSVRFTAGGALFGSGGYCAFADDEKLFYILALMNNKVNNIFVSIVSPTLNYEVGHIKTIPVIYDESRLKDVDYIVEDNIQKTKTDWDSFETSWEFKKHPLI
ncbi:BREX-1 system adenine-specific DNA-methyltransferase PglX [Pumilibacter muris]|uniref:BREX-1 system adenine-specific DNA-methyltransferase PglX n=1 Tax=Pumilibacter muris TaxID=2941510 RepID=UPI00204161BA|nr:BREX-1 system adenine-specific DNA-methyltransferase PglX [Pumilibacter muris]